MITFIDSYFQTLQEQPFIENAKDEDGKISFYDVLSPFTQWVYNQTDTLPKFDIASLFVATPLQNNIIGLAHLNAACEHNLATTVISESGFYDAALAAHEIGHV